MSNPFSMGRGRWVPVARRVFTGLAALCFAIAFAACETVDRRIARNPELFASFSPEDQDLIRRGKVAVEFTPEMVRLAWGRPDRRTTTRTRDGDVETWEYITRRSAYDGRRFAGYHRDVFYDAKSDRHRTVWSPVYVTTYRTIESERGRVEFQDGQVVSVTTVE